MTSRRWVVLLSWIALGAGQASQLAVRGGEISASAAKVFLTAATAGDKSTAPSTQQAAGTAAATTVAPAPTAAAPTTAGVPTLTAEQAAAQAAAAVPPALEAEAEKSAAPNVLRPTAEQLAERVTPNADGPLEETSRSSRRAPAPLPSAVAAPVSAVPTLAPPPAMVATTPSPAPAALPDGGTLLLAEKPTSPQELKPAAPQSAVTGNIELPSLAETTPTVTAPTAAPALAAKPEPDAKPLDFDPATGKTYHNVLRNGPAHGGSPLRPQPGAAASNGIDLTPAFAGESNTGTEAKPAVAAKPELEATSPAAKSAVPPTATTVVSDAPRIAQPQPAAAAVNPTPKPAPALAPSTSPAISAAAGPSPVVATPTPAGVRPNSLLSPGDEPPSQRAAVSKAPTGPETKKLFEATEEPPALTPEQEALRRRVQGTLATYYQNWTLNTREHSPWEVMHAIIAYGVDTQLNHNGKPITAIGHLCFSGVSNRQQIVSMSRSGRLHMNLGPGVQGHAGQFLAIVAQSQLQRDYPLYVGGQEFTLEDLIKAEQYDCESGTELTFKLIGLMHYLPSDAEWTNFQGQKWSLDRLVREEIVQPVRGAACGGTHRLMGLSYAVRKREQRGEPIVGIYKEAEKYINEYHKYTFGLQNPDGSFSTAWFVRREARLDLDRRLQTTGHVLEWLCFSLSDEQLRDPRVTKSVKYVTDLLLDENHEWQIGHLGHALHALQIYNERMYGGPIRSIEGMVSRRPIKTAKQPFPDVSNQ